MNQVGKYELSPELEVSRGTNMVMSCSTMRLSSQDKILTNDKNMHVWKDPFYPANRVIQSLQNSVWLQQAWQQVLMSFLIHCLIKPVLQMRLLRERYQEICSGNSFLFRFPSCQTVLVCDYIFVYFTTYFLSCGLWGEQITVPGISIIQRVSYKMWVETDQWVLAGVRRHMANISHFLVFM